MTVTSNNSEQLKPSSTTINHLVQFCNAYDNIKLAQATTVATHKFTHQKYKKNPGPSPTSCEYCAGPTHK